MLVPGIAISRAGWPGCCISRLGRNHTTSASLQQPKVRPRPFWPSLRGNTSLGMFFFWDGSKAIFFSIMFWMINATTVRNFQKHPKAMATWHSWAEWSLHPTDAKKLKVATCYHKNLDMFFLKTKSASFLGGFSACHAIRTLATSFQLFGSLFWVAMLPRTIKSMPWTLQCVWWMWPMQHLAFDDQSTIQMGRVSWARYSKSLRKPGIAPNSNFNTSFFLGVPSGELTFCNGKSPFLMGKSTILYMGHFP